MVTPYRKLRCLTAAIDSKHGAQQKPETKQTTNLFSDGLPAKIGGPVTLICFAEKRVKRSGKAFGGVGVAGDGEGGYVSQSETAVFVSQRSGSVQTFCVFEVLG